MKSKPRIKYGHWCGFWFCYDPMTHLYTAGNTPLEAYNKWVEKYGGK